VSAPAPPDPGARGRLTARAALASIAVAVLLLLLKGHAAWQTDSVAMLGSLADTGLDLIAALVTFWGLRIAAVPADREHRFGHGKAEALAALFQVVLIALSAMGIASRAIGRVSAGAATANAEQGIAVSLIALVLTGGLIAYQRRIIAATGSLAIRADRIHYTSDLLLNGAVIVALVLDQYLGVRGADPLAGIAIAFWLLWGAWGAAAAAIDQLMDKEWPEERRQRFLAVAARHPALRGIHDLRTRSSGAHDFVQFHVWVDPQISVAEAHRVMDEVEAALAREFPGVEILIHPDPEGHADKAS
jgi:ferrous-iron efflux pump FieF